MDRECLVKIGEPVPLIAQPPPRSRWKDVYLAVVALQDGQALPVECDDIAQVRLLQHAASCWGSKVCPLRLKVHTRVAGTTVYIWPHRNGK